MAAYIEIPQLVIWWSFYALFTHYFTVFLAQIFQVHVHCTKTKHLVYL